MLVHSDYLGIFSVCFTSDASLFITTMTFSCIELAMGGATTLNGMLYHKFMEIINLRGSLFFTGPIPLIFACISEYFNGNFFAMIVE